jgi:hypothetical protein
MTRPTSGAGRLARYGFADAVRAAALLGDDNGGVRLWDEAAQRPVDDAGASC